MSFEEAGRQFAQLQAQFRSGQLPEAHFQQMVALLRVQDAAGYWWQIEPSSAQWMMWNGAQWVWPQPQQQPAQPMAPQAARPMPATMPQASFTATPKKAAVSIWEGFAPVLPGLAIGLVQGWPQYSKDYALLAGFAIPSLLPAVLVPLVPKIGRVAAILLVLGCLVWLSWPVLMQLNAMLGNAKVIQAQAGRGLVGLSLLYLIPRIWRMQ